MIKLIAILILSGQLQVAVENDSGYAEASFENTRSGVQELIKFAEDSVGDTPDGARVVIGWVGDDHNNEHIVAAFAEIGLEHGVVFPSDIQAAVIEHKLKGPSARSVALADEKRFGFLYRKKQ